MDVLYIMNCNSSLKILCILFWYFWRSLECRAWCCHCHPSGLTSQKTRAGERKAERGFKRHETCLKCQYCPKLTQIVLYIAHSAPTTKGPDCCDVAYRGRRSLQRFRHLLTKCALRLATSTWGNAPRWSSAKRRLVKDMGRHGKTRVWVWPV